MSNLAKQINDLSEPGPYKVLVGDLSVTSLAGLMYVPEKATNIPAVVFSHDWTFKAKDYDETLRYLASWGIATVALDEGTGLRVDQSRLSANTVSLAEIIRNVKLGAGKTRVNPSQIYLVGEGMGAGISTISANAAHAAGVISIYPTETNPSAEDAALSINSPGLILLGDDTGLIPSNGEKQMAYNWGENTGFGSLARIIKDGTPHGFSENRVRRFIFGSTKSEKSQRILIRALMAGFILAGVDKSYADFRDQDEDIKNARTVEKEDLFEEKPKKTTTLLKAANKLR